MKRSVLFVCMGNICRSPTGEGVLQALIERRDLESKVRVDSAGTIGYHTGNQADRRMSAAALKRGYRLLSRARQVTRQDLDMFDLVVAMDDENYRDLIALASGDQVNADIRMLSDYLDDHWPNDVPDPYYGGPQGFEFVLDMIEEACPKVLESMVDDG